MESELIERLNLLPISEDGWMQVPPDLVALIRSAPSTFALTFSLPEVQALAEVFGGENASVCVTEFPEGKRDEEPMPAGKYAWFPEYQDEGAIYLGKHDPDVECASSQIREQTASERSHKSESLRPSNPPRHPTDLERG